MLTFHVHNATITSYGAYAKELRRYLQEREVFHVPGNQERRADGRLYIDED